jgi:hypothetical protein
MRPPRRGHIRASRSRTGRSAACRRRCGGEGVARALDPEPERSLFGALLARPGG